MAIQIQNRPSAAKGMPGSDRVAAILLTMGKSLSARLMKHFEADEIRQITRSASELRPVSAPQLGSLIEDFATQFALGASLVSSPAEVQRMLDGVLPKEQIEEIMGEVAGKPDHSTWDRISAVNESALAAYILSEHPQTAALILSKIKSATAAKVIALLPADERDGLIRRMLSVKPVGDEAMRLFERVAAERVQRQAGAARRRRGQRPHRRHHQQARQRPGRGDPGKPGVDAAEDRRGAEEPAVHLRRPRQAVAAGARHAVRHGAGGQGGAGAQGHQHRVPRGHPVVAVLARAQDDREELNNGQAVPAREVIEARRSIVDLALDHAGARRDRDPQPGRRADRLGSRRIGRRWLSVATKSRKPKNRQKRRSPTRSRRATSRARARWRPSPRCSASWSPLAFLIGTRRGQPCRDDVDAASTIPAASCSTTAPTPTACCGR